MLFYVSRQNSWNARRACECFYSEQNAFKCNHSYNHIVYLYLYLYYENGEEEQVKVVELQFDGEAIRAAAA